MADGRNKQLSDDDISVLLESLEAWVSKDFAGEMMGDLLGSMFIKDDPIAKAKFDDERLAQKVNRDREKVVRKERSIILRSKLLMMRNERRVSVVEAAIR